MIVLVSCHNVTNDKTNSKNSSKYPIIDDFWSVDNPTHAHWLGKSSQKEMKTIASAFGKTNYTTSNDTVYDTVLVNAPKHKGLTLQPATWAWGPKSQIMSGYYMKFIDSSETNYPNFIYELGVNLKIKFPDWPDSAGSPPIKAYPSDKLPLYGWKYKNGILTAETYLYHTKADWDSTGLDKMDIIVKDTALARQTAQYQGSKRRVIVYRLNNMNGILDVIKQMGTH